MTDQMATVFAELTKSEEQEDGTLLVYGSVSDETLDIDKQIADGTWLKGAVPEWFRSGGNVREMHQPIAAGVATEYAEKDGVHEIVAHVVDANSIKKVNAKVLRGFSIGIRGPRVIHDKAAAGGRIVGGQIVEVSLVDRPANPSCTLRLAKAATPGTEVIAADFDQSTGLVKVEELTEAELPTPAVVDGNPPAVETPAAEKAAGVGSPEGEGIDKREFSAEERKQLGAKGKAMPGGGFPIVTVEDLKNAIHAIGRAKDPAAAKAHIKARAKALGRTDLVPKEWGDATKSVHTDDEHAHDPATLEQIRNGLLQCLIAEAQEAMGGERELYDMAALLESLAMFMNWWDSEAWEGEAPSSTSEKSTTTEEPAVAAVTPIEVPVKVTVDTSELDKAAGGTLPENAEVDTVKSVVAEAVKTVEEGLLSRLETLLAPLTARLETVEKMAAPGGPSRMRTKAASITAHRKDQLNNELLGLKTAMLSVDSNALREGYGKLVAEKTAQLEALNSADL